MDVPAETAFFVGCTSAFVRQNMAVDTVGTLERLGVDYTLLSDERCCGHPYLAAGELDKARQAVLGSWRWRQERLGGSVRESERRYVEAEWRRARTVFAEALAELNSKIADFNLMAPVARLHKFKLDVAQELHLAVYLGNVLFFE